MSIEARREALLVLARAIIVAAVVLGDGLEPPVQVAVLAVLEAALAVLVAGRDG